MQTEHWERTMARIKKRKVSRRKIVADPFKLDPQTALESLRQFRVGDRVQWRMPFVGSVVRGEVSRHNRASISIDWDHGISGWFEFDNRMIWNLERL